MRRLTRAFNGIYRDISERVEAGAKGTQVEEWLLDNRHVLQDSLALVAESLPRGFLRELPRAGDGPRIRAVAEALVCHNEPPLDLARIQSLLRRYQP